MMIQCGDGLGCEAAYVYLQDVQSVHLHFFSKVKIPINKQSGFKIAIY